MRLNENHAWLILLSLSTQVSLTLTLCCVHLNSWLAHGRLPVPARTVFVAGGQEVAARQAVGGVELVIELDQDLVGVEGARHVALPDVARARWPAGCRSLMIFIATGSSRFGTDDADDAVADERLAGRRVGRAGPRRAEVAGPLRRGRHDGGVQERAAWSGAARSRWRRRRSCSRAIGPPSVPPN